MVFDVCEIPQEKLKAVIAAKREKKDDQKALPCYFCSFEGTLLERGKHMRFGPHKGMFNDAARGSVKCPWPDCSAPYLHDPASLERHVESKHLEKAHECGDCGKKFATDVLLYTHQKSCDVLCDLLEAPAHDLDRGCLLCGHVPVQNTEFQLKKHMRTFHDRPLRVGDWGWLAVPQAQCDEALRRIQWMDHMKR